MPGPYGYLLQMFRPGARFRDANGAPSTMRIADGGTLVLDLAMTGSGAAGGQAPASIPDLLPGSYRIELAVADLGRPGATAAHPPERREIAAARLLVRSQPVLTWHPARLPAPPAHADPATGDNGPVWRDLGLFGSAAMPATLIAHRSALRRGDDTGPPWSAGSGTPPGGGYPVFVGLGAGRNVICFVADFWALPPDPADGARTGRAGSGPTRRGRMAGGDRMHLGQTLGERALASPSGEFRLVYQHDGDLVLNDNLGRSIWAAGAGGSLPGRCALHQDGNLVITGRSGEPVWSTGTTEAPVRWLVLRDTGVAVLEDARGRTIWSTATA